MVSLSVHVTPMQSRNIDIPTKAKTDLTVAKNLSAAHFRGYDWDTVMFPPHRRCLRIFDVDIFLVM